MLKKILSIIFVTFLFFGYVYKPTIMATNTPVDGGGGGNNYSQLIDIIKILFGGFGDTANLEEDSTTTQSTTINQTPASKGTTPDAPARDSQVSKAVSLQVDQILKANPQDVSIYKQASQITGVPWELLAGIHYREGTMNRNKSLASGGTIGTRELAPTYCSGKYKGGVGDPVPIGSGCGFKTLLDSAVWAARHLKMKAAGDLNGYQNIVAALAKYNGTGNQNCGKTPYKSCPPKFKYEDHNYVLSKFDKRHETMYIVYCGDGIKCNPPSKDKRGGAFTVAQIVLALGK